MNLIVNVIGCAVLVLCAVGVGIYRKYLEDHCDHYIHLHGDPQDVAVIDSQAAMCKRIAVLDKVKTALIVAAILYALVIAGLATYNAWNASAL